LRWLWRVGDLEACRDRDRDVGRLKIDPMN